MSRGVIDKYLRSHAQPEAPSVSLHDTCGTHHVLTVPAYDESSEDFLLLESLPDGAGVLVIVLVNGRDDSGAQENARNRSFLAWLRAKYGGGRAVGAHSTEHVTGFGGLLVMDRTADTLPLPAKQGVGLARKILCDVALSLRARGQLLADVIHCTDADARLPGDYFERVAARGAAPFAAVFPYAHTGDAGTLHRAGELYELSLRYYVIGLQRAGSPYAFQTIGSTIAVSMTAYASVRGFPRRHGAEDFYLLNKLAKVGPVERLGGAPIELRDRVSSRIPFGTGPAVQRIIDGEERRFYHPRSFLLLRDFLAGISVLAAGAETPTDTAALARALYPALERKRATELVDASGIAGAVTAAFERGADSRVRLRHLHTYFDAFRTLKFVHALRACELEEVGAAEAVAGLLGDPSQGVAHDVERLREVERTECGGDVGLASA